MGDERVTHSAHVQPFLHSVHREENGVKLYLGLRQNCIPSLWKCRPDGADGKWRMTLMEKCG